MHEGVQEHFHSVAISAQQFRLMCIAMDAFDTPEKPRFCTSSDARRSVPSFRPVIAEERSLVMGPSVSVAHVVKHGDRCLTSSGSHQSGEVIIGLARLGTKELFPVYVTNQQDKEVSEGCDAKEPQRRLTNRCPQIEAQPLG